MMDSKQVEEFSKNLTRILGDDDDDTRFWSWLAAVSIQEGGTAKAAADLGLDVPEGPRYGTRLKEAYLEATKEDRS